MDDAGAVYPITIDPVYTTAAWTFPKYAQTAGNYLFNAGDVNGDGYDDLIGENNKLVAVYFGGPDGLPDEPDQFIDGDSVWVVSISSAGDAHGAGYGDVLIGGYAAMSGSL